MNPGCNNCTSYPFHCDGAEDGANVAGCITLPTDTTYDSAMIEDDEELSLLDNTQRRRGTEDGVEFENDDDPQSDIDRRSLSPVDRARGVDEKPLAAHGRVSERPAANGRTRKPAAMTTDAADGAGDVGFPSAQHGPVAAYRPFGFFSLDPHHASHKNHVKEIL